MGFEVAATSGLGKSVETSVETSKKQEVKIPLSVMEYAKRNGLSAEELPAEIVIMVCGRLQGNGYDKGIDLQEMDYIKACCPEKAKIFEQYSESEINQKNLREERNDRSYEMKSALYAYEAAQKPSGIIAKLYKFFNPSGYRENVENRRLKYEMAKKNYLENRNQQVIAYETLRSIKYTRANIAYIEWTMSRDKKKTE